MKKLILWLFLSLAAHAQSSAVPKMLEIAREQWNDFGQQTIGTEGNITHPGHLEAEPGYAERVGVFWREGVGRDLSGYNTEEAWSAAFISYVMRKAGLGHRFAYDEWHAHYIRQAIQARHDRDPSFAFWGYRLSERAPQVGDMVAYSRTNGVNFDTQPDTYPSHCDIVVAVRPGQIDVIGGNVADSVTLKTLKTDRNGLLVDKHHEWFAVLAFQP